MQIRLVLLGLLLAMLPARAAWTADTEIVSEEDTGRAWSRSNHVPPPAWPAADLGVDRACVNLMYWIDRKGATADPLVLHAWAPGVPDTPEGLRQLAPFAQSAALTLADWRFERAEGNSKGRALITNVVFLFARDAGTDLAALRRECLVGDLRDFVYGKTDAGYRRGNLNKGLLERQRAEYPPTIPDGCTRHPGWCD